MQAARLHSVLALAPRCPSSRVLGSVGVGRLNQLVGGQCLLRRDWGLIVQNSNRQVTAASTGGPPAVGSTMDASSNRHAPGLFLFWTLAAGSAAYVAVAKQQVAPDLALLVDCTFWLAVVCSISLTEAWVKFRAPLLERWVGVDVGRRVFRAEYAMELALALAAAAILYAKSGSAQGALALLAGPQGRLLAGAGAILLLDVAVVFPALDLRGKNLIAASVQPDSLSPQQQGYVAELLQQVAGRANPPAQLHLLSVVLAFTKAGLLAAYVWQLLLQLA